MFAKYGIEPSIVALAGDAKVQEALASDSIDFGLGGGPGMAFAAKGSPGLAVADFAGAPRDLCVFVAADSPIRTVTDLKGKIVTVSPQGSLTDWMAMQVAITGTAPMRILWIYDTMRVTRTFAADGVEVEHLSQQDLMGVRS